ncbi:hypothetical protein VHEMI01285 [[Torrubiella] hemipterigena]|uniref:Uncharacterized protein n=1 Tax=[Torrubiella] hemipterigena TaxID=1531966 RepID=A0A0A1T518_9HYPO|nr:hypothetical protein VHEMI01285 [[Torrubiella] hemipterigena]
MTRLAAASSPLSPRHGTPGSSVPSSRSEENDRPIPTTPVFDNHAGTQPLMVPGLGLPLNAEPPSDHRFAHPFGDWCQDRLTGMELSMMICMNLVTDGPGWHKKIMDDDSARAMIDKQHTFMPLSQKAKDWCLLELRDKARAFDEETGYVTVYESASQVCKTDKAVSPSLLTRFTQGIKHLVATEDIPFGGWRFMRLLVNPSAYPLVYGTSPILVDGSKTTELDDEPTIPNMSSLATFPAQNHIVFSDEAAKAQTKTDHQWLPCEVSFIEAGEKDVAPKVKITSYINGIPYHGHQDLYESIEELISISVPMWNEVLLWKDKPRHPPRILTYGAEWATKLPPWASKLPEADKDPTGPLYTAMLPLVKEYLRRLPHPVFRQDDLRAQIMTRDEPDVIRGTLADAIEQHSEYLPEHVHPDPGISFTYEDWKRGDAYTPIIPPVTEATAWVESPKPEKHQPYKPIKLQEQFKDEGLQVIIEVQQIEPDQRATYLPMFPSGINGYRNEHIVATSVMYFDSVNTNATMAPMSLRAPTVLYPRLYQPDLYSSFFVEQYGITEGTRTLPPGNPPAEYRTMQSVGPIVMPDGRLVAYPNALHRSNASIFLHERGRPYHRRMIAMHLVDPHVRICSTRNVPPQQHGKQWLEAMFSRGRWPGRKLPVELVQMILSYIDYWPLAENQEVAPFGWGVSVYRL